MIVQLDLWSAFFMSFLVNWQKALRLRWHVFRVLLRILNVPCRLAHRFEILFGRLQFVTLVERGYFLRIFRLDCRYWRSDTLSMDILKILLFEKLNLSWDSQRLLHLDAFRPRKLRWLIMPVHILKLLFNLQSLVWKRFQKRSALGIIFFKSALSVSIERPHVGWHWFLLRVLLVSGSAFGHPRNMVKLLLEPSLLHEGFLWCLSKHLLLSLLSMVDWDVMRRYRYPMELRLSVSWFAYKWSWGYHLFDPG